jgi:hypothetical protein
VVLPMLTDFVNGGFAESVQQQARHDLPDDLPDS